MLEASYTSSLWPHTLVALNGLHLGHFSRWITKYEILRSLLSCATNILSMGTPFAFHTENEWNMQGSESKLKVLRKTMAILLSNKNRWNRRDEQRLPLASKISMSLMSQPMAMMYWGMRKTLKFQHVHSSPNLIPEKNEEYIYYSIIKWGTCTHELTRLHCQNKILSYMNGVCMCL